MSQVTLAHGAVGANSEAPDCSVTILRDWAKVTCTGDMLGFENFEGFGVEGGDYFKTFTAGKLLSFVVRLRKGQSQKVRMCRPKERASLFVSWPPGKDKPTIVALQRGPKCDKSAWGASQPAKPHKQAVPNPHQPSPHQPKPRH